MIWNTPPLLKTPDSLPLVNPDEHALGVGFFRDHLKMVRIEWVFKENPLFDPAIRNTAQALITEGCEGFNSAQFHDEMEFLGAFMDRQSGPDFLIFSLVAPVNTISSALSLYLKALQSPRYDLTELSRYQNIQEEKLKVSLEKTSTLASRMMTQKWFGDHSLGKIVSPGDYLKVSRENILSYFDSVFSQGPQLVVICGGGNKRLFEESNPWKSRTPLATLKPIDLSFPSMPGKYHVTKTDAVQTSVNIAFPGPPRTSADYLTVHLGVMVLGGYFGSRLMKNIREEKGFTYGIHAAPSPHLFGTRISIQTDMKAEVAEEGMLEIEKEIAKIKAGLVSESELQSARNYMIGSMVRNFENVFSIADRYKHLWTFGLDKTYYSQWIQDVSEINAEKIQVAMQSYLQNQRSVTVSAGPHS